MVEYFFSLFYFKLIHYSFALRLDYFKISHWIYIFNVLKLILKIVWPKLLYVLFWLNVTCYKNVHTYHVCLYCFGEFNVCCRNVHNIYTCGLVGAKNFSLNHQSIQLKLFIAFSLLCSLCWLNSESFSSISDARM